MSKATIGELIARLESLLGIASDTNTTIHSTK